MIHLNYFDKLNEQSQACLSYAIARNSLRKLKINNFNRMKRA